MLRISNWVLSLLGGLLVIAVAAAPGVGDAADIKIQWQTSNLTEKQYRPIWEEMVAEFEAKHPGVKIEPILVARKSHWTKFVTAAQARKAPDAVMVDTIPAAYNGYLRPLDDLWAAEPESYRKAWSADVLSATRYKGKLYGIPSWGGIYAEVYNRELVEKAGLDPVNPPKNWDEYLAWAKKLTEKDQWATAILGGPTSTTTRILLSWIYSNGGRAFNDEMTEATFAKDPRSLEAIKFYLGLATRHGVATPGATTINYLEQTNLFAQKKIATMRNAYWGFAKVTIDNPKLKGKLFVTFPPRQVEKPLVVARMGADSISSNCEHPKEAWEFIKFKNQRKWAVKRLQVANWMPLRNDVADDPQFKDDPILQKYLEIGKYSKTIPLPHPAYADIAGKDVVSAVQKALLEPERTEDIFRDLDKQLTVKLNDY